VTIPFEFVLQIAHFKGDLRVEKVISTVMGNGSVQDLFGRGGLVGRMLASCKNGN
jgi:hypothetical protein